MDDRILLSTGGVSASLARGVLSVVSSNPDAPVVVDVEQVRVGRRFAQVVVVEGVGAFRAAAVRKVVVAGFVGETIAVNPSGRCHPRVQVTTAPNPNPAAVVSAGAPLARFTATPPSSFTGSPTPFVTYTPPVSTYSAPTTSTTSAPSTPPMPAFTGSSQSPNSLSATAIDQAIIAAVNQAREAAGLSDLTENSQLDQMATLQSANMATYNVMAHTIPQAAQPTLASRASYTGYSYSLLGENIAFGYTGATDVMNAWLNSPPHRANILNPAFTQIGVALAPDSNGNEYFTQEFGTPST